MIDQLTQSNEPCGELMEFKNGIIHVKCRKVVAREKQDDICNKCFWHHHPKRKEGWILDCKMV